MKRIGITLGDPCGIGPEVTQKALQDPRISSLELDFTVFGSNDLTAFRPGEPSLQSGQAAYQSLIESAEAIKKGEIDAVVTAPSSKEWLQRAGFSHPGQTEFYAEQQQVQNFAMCLTGQKLTVALTTIHIPLSAVPKTISKEEIIRVGHLLASHQKRLGQAHPKIAVCGLNPHAGENGAFGREEIELIAPAIEKLNQQDLNTVFSGPHVPDAIFRQAADGHYDAVLAMYHDQGLIPLKLLDFDAGVNVTLGLPTPRTSPDHGTAFDIAGEGIASPNSMIGAILLAAKLVAD